MNRIAIDLSWFLVFPHNDDDDDYSNDFQLSAVFTSYPPNISHT